MQACADNISSLRRSKTVTIIGPKRSLDDVSVSILVGLKRDGPPGQKPNGVRAHIQHQNDAGIELATHV